MTSSNLFDPLEALSVITSNACIEDDKKLVEDIYLWAR